MIFDFSFILVVATVLTGVIWGLDSWLFKPQRVAARAIAHHEVHLVQRQRRGRAQFVCPAHGAVADDELGLLEEPVRGLPVVVAAAREVQPADVDLAVRGPAHIELGPIDIKLLEPEVP